MVLREYGRVSGSRDLMCTDRTVLCILYANNNITLLIGTKEKEKLVVTRNMIPRKSRGTLPISLISEQKPISVSVFQ